MSHQSDQIIHLNVGGTRFSTSKQTLTWIPDSFFTAMLSGRISTNRDESGSIFIDRDPKMFSIILNYLRTKEIDLNGCDISMLRHECEYYCVTPLVKRLQLCEDLERSQCGDVLFNGYINPPVILLPQSQTATTATTVNLHKITSLIEPTTAPIISNNQNPLSNTTTSGGVKPGTVFRLGTAHSFTGNHYRNSSLDFRNSATDFTQVAAVQQNNNTNNTISRGHSRASSTDSILWATQQSSLSSTTKHPLPGCLRTEQNLLSVTLLAGHHNWIAAAYSYYIICYKMKDASGWQTMFHSEHQEDEIYRLAINARTQQGETKESKLVAIAFKQSVRLWSITDETNTIIGTFLFGGVVDNLFFIGSQLVACGGVRKVGVWHSLSQQWQTQELTPIKSFDTAGSFLLLGGETGSIYYFDMQKFPLRMKDNDLLITEIYKIEIAYGTSSGIIRVIVQHPETVGHGPQLFQTFCVHRSPVTKVFDIMLSERHLISVCAANNHVRTWNVTRFRGMISTQPGSTPLASYRIVSIEPARSIQSYTAGNDIGPYGDRDDQQVFVQKVIPYDTEQIYIRFCSTGKRVAIVKSVDNSPITCFTVHECEGPSRLSTRPRRFIFTGHENGSIQVWDLTTAIELCSANSGAGGGNCSENQIAVNGGIINNGGPTPIELVKLLDHCDFSHISSRCTTPCCSLSGVASNNVAQQQHRPQQQRQTNINNSIPTNTHHDENSVKIDSNMKNADDSDKNSSADS
ncbi:unnamed protein product [Didymodactylos carnosus]|uniref:BTB domain-containing protein n=1 Tax=Didymodactylos carnosus TaxID=1234261 RepID=A0A8S2I624_9BILA|nr:unnamed protein product [Didymodactylos carnosus]CAF3722059.1 unnamed protein product [Didymodactylos carnosus]